MLYISLSLCLKAESLSVIVEKESSVFMVGKGESPKVGIDLGTLHPCVGLSKTPSYVAFTGNE